MPCCRRFFAEVMSPRSRIFPNLLLRRQVLAILFASALCTVLTLGQEPTSGDSAGLQGTGRNWYKGNIHTLNSNGDSTPDEVVRWYREHGYHFLVLCNHNFLTSVDALNTLHGADEQFLVIRGEEVTDELPTQRCTSFVGMRGTCEPRCSKPMASWRGHNPSCQPDRDGPYDCPVDSNL